MFLHLIMKHAKHWEQFRELTRQTSTKALATSYKSYVNNQIGDCLKTNPKRFWSFIKANKRENIGIPTLRVNDKPITNDRDKANALNSQFTSVFTSERYPIPVIDQGSTLAVFRYPEHPRFSDGIPDSPEQ